MEGLPTRILFISEARHMRNRACGSVVTGGRRLWQCGRRNVFVNTERMKVSALYPARGYAREERLISLVKSCGCVKDIEQIHGLVLKSGLEQNVFVIGRIITLSAINVDGLMGYAVSIFKQIKQPDGFIWNNMIRGFGKANRSKEAFDFYNGMLHVGEMADNFTFCFLLKICGQLKATKLGMQLHCSVLKYGLDSHIFVRNTLVHVYAELRDIATARQLFEENPKSNVVTWNSIIDGCVYCGLYQEALTLFLRMLRSGLQPDDATLVVVLSACSSLGELNFGRWIHKTIRGTGLACVLAVSNSLIDMYAKCGAIEDARDIFAAMPERNVVTWNSIIIGLAAHGHAEEALNLFSEMQKWGIEAPNDVTFLGVLSACSHRGLVVEGRRYFERMMKDYGIQPSIKHYGCMVDLLGRAGLVNEAYELICSMRVECTSVVWRTLLAACRVHGNVELGEKLRMHLLKLEPDHSSDYVLLSNMYASAGRWTDQLNIRSTMTTSAVKKPKPGNSLVDELLLLPL